MSSSEKRAEELLDQLTLDIKAFVLLQGSEGVLREKLQQKVVDSQDDSVRQFVSALQGEKKPKSTHLFLIALGELLLASLLVFAGAVALIPSAAGVNTPAALIQFFSEKAYGAIGSSPLSQYVSFVEFIVGAVLMLSALYTLRQAALNLKEMGLSVRSGEA